MALPLDIRQILNQVDLAIPIYELSRFYSTGPITGTSPWNYTDFTDYVTRLEPFLANPLTRGAVTNSICWRISAQINNLYLATYLLLSDRALQVTKEYERIRGNVEKQKVGRRKIAIADRDANYTGKCLGDTLDKYKALLKSIEAPLSKPNLSRFPKSYLSEWSLVRECGSICMQEISFLSKRVDDFGNILNAVSGFNLALVGIGASALFSLIGLGISSCQNSNSSLEQIASNTSGIYSELKDIAAHPANNKDEAIVQQLKNLNSNTHDIAVALGNSASSGTTGSKTVFQNINGNLENIGGGIEKLTEAVNNKELKPPIVTVPPPNLAPILEKLDEIKGAVNNLTDAVKNKRAEPTATPEVPEYHGWGVGWIRFRPSKVAH